MLCVAGRPRRFYTFDMVAKPGSETGCEYDAASEREGLIAHHHAWERHYLVVMTVVFVVVAGCVATGRWIVAPMGTVFLSMLFYLLRNHQRAATCLEAVHAACPALVDRLTPQRPVALVVATAATDRDGRLR